MYFSFQVEYTDQFISGNPPNKMNSTKNKRQTQNLYNDSIGIR